MKVSSMTDTQRDRDVQGALNQRPMKSLRGGATRGVYRDIFGV
ncbi:MAG: hypothetical protein WDO74_22455 [Pseudomonadota bacterium]